MVEECVGNKLSRKYHGKESVKQFLEQPVNDKKDAKSFFFKYGPNEDDGVRSWVCAGKLHRMQCLMMLKTSLPSNLIFLGIATSLKTTTTKYSLSTSSLLFKVRRNILTSGFQIRGAQFTIWCKMIRSSFANWKMTIQID